MRSEEPKLYVISEPEPVHREVLHISGIRSHGPAEIRAVTRPWPRQRALRELLRQPARKKVD